MKSYKEKFRSLNTYDLQEIISKSKTYHPDTVQAAKYELNFRGETLESYELKKSTKVTALKKVKAKTDKISNLVNPFTFFMEKSKSYKIYISLIFFFTLVLIYKLNHFINLFLYYFDGRLESYEVYQIVELITLIFGIIAFYKKSYYGWMLFAILLIDSISSSLLLSFEFIFEEDFLYFSIMRIFLAFIFLLPLKHLLNDDIQEEYQIDREPVLL